MNFPLFIARKIAGKDETGKRLTRTTNVIAIISVTLSIFVMFLALSIVSGFKKEISEKVRGFSGDIVLTPPGMAIVNDHYPVNGDLSYIEKIESMRQVERVCGVAYRPGMIKSDDNVFGILLKGVDSLYDMSFYSSHLTEGRLPDLRGNSAANEVLISRRLSDKIGLNTGDRLVSYYTGESVRIRQFTICGIYDVELQDVDQMLAIVDIRQVQRLNGWSNGEVSTIEIRLVSGSDKEVSVLKIEDIIMSESIDKDTPLFVTSVEDHYPVLFEWLNLLDYNVLIIMILMIIVAGFNMISGLLIILFEKISMIGVLKSLGMRDKSIAAIFLYRGSFLMLKGMLWGNVIGLLFALLQNKFHIITLDPQNYFVSFVPVNVTAEILLILNICSFIAITAMLIIPTLFISKISPDKSVRVK